MVAGSQDGKVYVLDLGTGKHHHALITEIDEEHQKVYTTENGKAVEISNLQLSSTYHLEIEIDKGTTIADGTSTGGDAKPTEVAPVDTAPKAGYTFTFSDGVTKKVLIQEVAPGTPAGPGIFTFQFDDGSTQKVKIEETI